MLKTVNFVVAGEVWQQLKEVAFHTGRSVSAILREAIEEWLRKRGYTPAAGVA